MPYKQPPKHTQFKPGQSGNPKGRTPGLSITAMIREELEKVPKGQKKPAKQLLVERIIKKAINEGDKEMIKLCWHYMDGKPIQKNEEIGEQTELPHTIIVEYVEAKHDWADESPEPGTGPQLSAEAEQERPLSA